LPARLSVAVWLGFIAYPLAATYSDARDTTLHLVVVSAVAAVFSAAYLAFCALPDPTRARMDRLLVVAVAAVLVGAVSFLVVYDRPEWVYSYVYCLWPAIVALGGRAWPAALLAGLAISVGAATGLSGTNLVSVAVVVLGVGAGVYGVTRLVAANETLRRAQADQAAAAVAEERLRFARDLHELLSHSLSVIALKSQVASRLVADQPGRAATEMADIEQITRQALHEVRDAVSGYRRPSLAVEIQGARRALGAAGIALRECLGQPDMPCGVEAPLAWALREGVTNVIRHSRASTCTISLDLSAREATLTVADDGIGPADHGPAAPAGNGLRGLAERVNVIGGTLDTKVGAEGGFLLSVSVPLPAGLSATSPPASRSVTGAAP
jgi:two-component system sensor histidine kinase DesK